MYSLSEKVKWIAIFSRLGIILLQFLANILMEDHVTDIFKKPLNYKLEKNKLNSAIELLFGGLIRWDAQYFLHITEYGYTYENTLAFFPLFPMIVRYISYFILLFSDRVMVYVLPVRYSISANSVHIVVSILLNNILFVFSAKMLFQLSLCVLKSEKLAYISAILFCFNPASIFFSAAYSESLFCFLVFCALLNMEQQNYFFNYALVGFTGAVRSNGVVNIGFLIYKFIKMRCKENLAETRKKTNFFIFNLGIIFALLPFLSYQFFTYTEFCVPKNLTLPFYVVKYGKRQGYVFPGEGSAWCNKSYTFSYAYVQNHYWGVGFLKYFQVRQIPNFFVAAPMIFIVIYGTVKFVRHYKFLILYLGFLNGDAGDQLPITIFPYIVHCLFLTIFAVLMIHVQVTSRLLASSSPIPYWFSALAISKNMNKSVEEEVLRKWPTHSSSTIAESFHEQNKNRKHRWRAFLFTENLTGYAYLIKVYFFLYYVLGTIAFSNNYPWT